MTIPRCKHCGRLAVRHYTKHGTCYIYCNSNDCADMTWSTDEHETIAGAMQEWREMNE
jgi:hypothetical protein